MEFAHTDASLSVVMLLIYSEMVKERKREEAIVNMCRPLSRLDLLAVILFLSVPAKRPAKHGKDTERRWPATMAEAASYEPVLGAEKQVTTTTLKRATSQCYPSSDKNKQPGFYQIKYWDCFHRAYRDRKEER